uniref:Succinate dehydrogenase assembly factor 4, mitochondrial n=1 Tax=Parastrongyloides trichosuri TaxID=131310 RepID=A0A0N4ZYY8_PARTI
MLLLRNVFPKRFISTSTCRFQQPTDTKKNDNKKKSINEQIAGKLDDKPKSKNYNEKTGEIGGPQGPEPTRYGDWERKGRVSDF